MFNYLYNLILKTGFPFIWFILELFFSFFFKHINTLFFYLSLKYDSHNMFPLKVYYLSDPIKELYSLTKLTVLDFINRITLDPETNLLSLYTKELFCIYISTYLLENYIQLPIVHAGFYPWMKAFYICGSLAYSHLTILSMSELENKLLIENYNYDKLLDNFLLELMQKEEAEALLCKLIEYDNLI